MSCMHLRAAVIASDALICGADGSEVRGSVRWCTNCGAILPLIGNATTRWLKPGSDEIAQALETLHARQADAALHASSARPRKGVARG